MGEKVWVVWDRLLEKVMSVHRSEESAQSQATYYSVERGRNDFEFEWDEFDLEDLEDNAWALDSYDRI